ncbi:hypothetical protein JK191_12855 [Gluconobacter sphaericus]|uniref:hypothetical protein n=1 Tax=Gluconobacter sphaericus TaxID=574987 RepID=UPI001B8C5D24|nr:hypothetical protein [Gluconobacter sphaericus]MBS1098423.1 hypothetical protein [Gluconobacter sphaericus]
MEIGTFTIALTQEEAAIAETMAFVPLVFLGDHQAFLKNADLAHNLTSSLLARDAIPEQRLRYFIQGASLPPLAEEAFTRAAHDCGPFSSGDMAPLGMTARQLARMQRLEPKAAADEFFKLCRDLGMSAGYAGSIRSSVQQLKSPR